MRFARELEEGSPFAPREVIAGKDARTLARQIPAMSQEGFTAAFRRSPMKRAKLRGMKRNAAVVLGSIHSEEDVLPLASTLNDSEPLVRRHAAWALGRVGSPEALKALRVAEASESGASVLDEIRSTLSVDKATANQAPPPEPMLSPTPPPSVPGPSPKAQTREATSERLITVVREVQQP
ncbi:MAG TPA: HEAT repeat domain-containing protein [Gemmatimonadaceae bacterium]|nr:HEAT repeat domain-containing protein [Gemmatimonadaceae bacterium]